jgi:hypothetical protein
MEKRISRHRRANQSHSMTMTTTVSQLPIAVSRYYLPRALDNCGKTTLVSWGDLGLLDNLSDWIR